MAEENYTREGLRVKDMIGYQEGAVVSKTLINKDAGNVTLFAFDAGARLSEHTAPFDALVFIIDGEARITIEGRAYAVKEGGMILMPANRPHALDAVSRFKMLLVMVKGALK